MFNWYIIKIGVRGKKGLLRKSLRQALKFRGKKIKMCDDFNPENQNLPGTCAKKNVL